MPAMFLLALTVATAVPEAPPVDDPKRIVCIAPRDARGQPEAKKVCKSVKGWTRYVAAETARQRRSQALAALSARVEPDRGPYVYGYPPAAVRR